MLLRVFLTHNVIVAFCKMSRILIFQHVAYELLGTLNPLLKEHRFRLRYMNFERHPHSRTSVAGYDGLIVLGGPMHVDQIDHSPHLVQEMRVIEEALKLDIPILGICLGAQLIAATLGQNVIKNPQKEIGWYDIRVTGEGAVDPVLGHFSSVEKIFQWHDDTFEIPRGALHLAESDTCANQAFRYGDKVYGFQFHLECDEATIYRWLEVPRHQAELKELTGLIDPKEIKAQTPLYIHQSMALSQKTFGKFLDLVGKPTRSMPLPSR